MKKLILSSIFLLFWFLHPLAYCDIGIGGGGGIIVIGPLNDAGGFTMVVLLAASVLSVAIILERLIAYRCKSRVKRKDFMLKMRQEIKKTGCIRQSRSVGIPILLLLRWFMRV